MQKRFQDLKKPSNKLKKHLPNFNSANKFSPKESLSRKYSPQLKMSTKIALRRSLNIIERR